MAINNTQKSVIEKKKQLRDKVIAALRNSEEFSNVEFFEIVGDCNIAFYVVDGNGRKQVFELAGSFKKANTKMAGQREPEQVMCDLLDKYDAKEEGRRCREALMAKEHHSKESEE